MKYIRKIYKEELKFLKSLHSKKKRKELGYFIVEGFKTIDFFLNSNYIVEKIFCKKSFFSSYEKNKYDLIEVTGEELLKVTTFKTPPGSLALIKIPINDINYKAILKANILLLDRIKDPGNLGTIIRTCDWFGINTIICSKDSVDCYNSKVVHSTMGSLSSVQVYYEELFYFLKKYTQKGGLVYGTYLNGESIYSTEKKSNVAILMGNEATGIDRLLDSFITYKVTIPKKNKNVKTESLNVAVATALVLNKFIR